MDQTPAKATPAADIMESVLMAGDLAKMSQADRVTYYNTLCKSLDLNPLTQPFAYITLNGKLTLYATRGCADQLRRNRKVSVEIVSKTLAAELFTVHVKATDIDGRHDEDLGVVSLPESARGEVRANAMLKCITKAKRRVTLSICGLGFLDETEVEDIPASAKAAPMIEKSDPGHDVEEWAPPPFDLLATARGAASHGEQEFKKFYKLRSLDEKQKIDQIGDELRELMGVADGVR